MDEADIGNEKMEKWLEAQLQEHAYQLNQVGNLEAEEEPRCRNCKEPLPAGIHYCDKDCATDFETRLASERRNGKYRGG